MICFSFIVVHTFNILYFSYSDMGMSEEKQRIMLLERVDMHVVSF